MNKNKKIVRLHAENHSAEALGIIFAYKQKDDHLVYSMYQGESVHEPKNTSRRMGLVWAIFSKQLKQKRKSLCTSFK